APDGPAGPGPGPGAPLARQDAPGAPSWTGQGPETHGGAQGVPLAEGWPDAGHARAGEPGGDGEEHSRVRTGPDGVDPATRRTGRR
ncbi:hypothetical protein AB1388_43655, partial [Streptomyces hydrogenans]